MCHGYWRERWERRMDEERRDEPVTFVSDPEVEEPPKEEEPRDPEREVVLTGARD
jgi:hypothetical protein